MRTSVENIEKNRMTIAKGFKIPWVDLVGLLRGLCGEYVSREYM